jgi:alpha-L-rhamnosidase
MQKLINILIVATILLGSNTQTSAQETEKDWASAKWIAMQQIPDSLKLVPGLHTLGRRSGNSYKTRSTVPVFRKAFSVNNTIESATIDISGLGHYELHINGNKIGNRFLSPGWSNYNKRQFYNTYDITKNIKDGKNVIGVLVGNGFYNINNERYHKLIIAYGYPKLIFKVKIKFSDGSIQTIVSDESCKVAPSPITFSSIYGGEDYDAILEKVGWSLPGFDDSNWQRPVIINETINNLELEKDNPLRIMQEFDVENISTSKTGRTIYDFGQNASGIISLKVKGNRGTQITIRPDELLNDEGNVTQRSGGGPYEFNYTLKGEGTEEWQPRFTYYGFRYADVEIIEPENATKKTEIVEIKSLHTRNSAPTVGSFSCSDTLFNQTFELINWGIKSNMASVATDCPHREKLGWLEQTYLIGPSMHYNFDIHKMYSKIITDMMDSQLDNGLVPDIAPEYVEFEGGFRDSPEWGSASIIIPWQMYKWYGDKQVLSKAYPMMKKYADYLHTKTKGNLLEHGLGDWYDLGPKHPGVAQLTPKAVTATSIYYYDLQIITKTAQLLGNHADIDKYEKLSQKVKEAFLKQFYNVKTGTCSTQSQTAYAMPLYAGLIPEADYTKVFNNLGASIRENDYALTSGDIGYHFLVRVLSENGRSDLLYKMNNRNDRPGYGFQLKQGATALTESWAALKNVSNNHMMLGHLMEWFYSGLGGIYQTENSVAYKDLIIAPKTVGNIQWVKCSYNSINGLVSSEWKKTNDSFILDVEIPNNTTATVILPNDYVAYKCTVINNITNSQLDMNTEEGRFILTSGKYKIIAK